MLSSVVETSSTFTILLILFGLVALPSCERASEASELANVPASLVEMESAHEETNEGSFSLLIYNIAGLPWVVSSSDPVNNTPVIGSLLNAYDIVLLQEDFWYHTDLIPKITLPYRSEPQDSDPSVFDLHDGLNRFSKFPFRGVSRKTWRACAGYLTDSCDCLARKGFSSAMMSIGGGTRVRVYNVHFDAGESDTDVDARKDQFRQLADHIKANADGEAIIVGGDVNLVDAIPRDSENLQTFLAETGLKDGCQELQCNDELFDKVLFRSSETLTFEIESRTLPPEFVSETNKDLSDHKPVSVVLKWNKSIR